MRKFAFIGGILLSTFLLTLPASSQEHPQLDLDADLGEFLSGGNLDNGTSGANRNVASVCRALGGFANPDRAPEHCSPINSYNHGILQAICELPIGGGYDAALDAVPFGVSNDLTVAGHNLLDESYRNLPDSRRTSYCSGASYAAFLKMLENLGPENPLRDLTMRQIQQFDFYNYCGQSNGNHQDRTRNFRRRDFIGFFGAVNNDYKGWVDANTVFDFGDSVVSVSTSAELTAMWNNQVMCPGDLIKYSRSSSGHNAVFLGYLGSKFCYWSSNGRGVPSSREGLTVRCESKSVVRRMHAVRVTDNVHQLSWVVPYDGSELDWSPDGRGSGIQRP